MGCGASTGGGGERFDPNSPIGLSHFQVERVLGEGGFGKVKYVRHKGTDKGYAMKCMDKHIILEKKQIKMIFKERALLVDLSMPDGDGSHCRFITNLHFAFQDEHLVYLVMDLALGGTLKFHLKKHPKGYPLGHAKFYTAQVYSGLIYLHSKLILYRDCKPENILLNSDGYCMLSDFGVSEKFQASDTMMKGKTGTKAYMPPESLRGEQYGLEFDWWSFGVTVYELLCASLPKGSGDMLSFSAGTDSQGEDFVRQLLEPDRAERLGVADEGAIKSHPFLADTDWKGLANQEVPAPFKPDPKRANFDAHQDDIMAALDVNQKDARAPLAPDQESQFAMFPWPPTDGLPDNSACPPTIGPDVPGTDRDSAKRNSVS